MGINLADKGYYDVIATLPGDFPKLPADGYICQVINAEITNSKAGNLMLILYLDIAQGNFAGHFKAALNRVNSPSIKWDNAAIYRQLLFDNDSGRVSRFFKGLLTCFEFSNPTFKINITNFDASSLRGKLIGFVFAEEEYSKKNGDIASRIFAKFPKTVDDIQSGNFSVPELKKIQQAKTAGNTPNINNYDFGGDDSIDPNDTPF